MINYKYKKNNNTGDYFFIESFGKGRYRLGALRAQLGSKAAQTVGS